MNYVIVNEKQIILLFNCRILSNDGKKILFIKLTFVISIYKISYQKMWLLEYIQWIMANKHSK